MKHFSNIKTSSFSWLGSSYKHIDCSLVSEFYEPETIEELKNICIELNNIGRDYLVIGHTSNLYFTPSCLLDVVVSTRKLTKWSINEDTEGTVYCECQCGVHVRKLSTEMVKLGYRGFYGLCDLPGTVGSAIYGNAGCYDCDLSSKLHFCDVLLKDGTIKTFNKSELEFSKRMSIFKNKALQGVILRSVFFLERGDIDEEYSKMCEVRANRKATQPGPLNNLGSIYCSEQEYTIYGRTITILARLLSFINKKNILYNVLLLSRKLYLLPYVYQWNRYIWKDKQSHEFWLSYVSLHNKIFRYDKFEIEII